MDGGNKQYFPQVLIEIHHYNGSAKTEYWTLINKTETQLFFWSLWPWKRIGNQGALNLNLVNN